MCQRGDTLKTPSPGVRTYSMPPPKHLTDVASTRAQPCIISVMQPAHLPAGHHSVLSLEQPGSTYPSMGTMANAVDNPASWQRQLIFEISSNPSHSVLAQPAELATTLMAKSILMRPLHWGHLRKFNSQNSQTPCCFLFCFVFKTHPPLSPFPLSFHLFIIKHLLILLRKECKDIFTTTTAPFYL